MKWVVVESSTDKGHKIEITKLCMDQDTGRL